MQLCTVLVLGLWLPTAEVAENTQCIMECGALCYQHVTANGCYSVEQV